MDHTPIRVGAIGLGRAFMLMLPTFVRDPRVRLVAAFDPRPEAREQFARDFGGVAYDSADALCARPDLEAVYIASPHQFHVEHVRAAAKRGKHVLVEKPMALTLKECLEITELARAAGIRVIVGHSHSFDTPYLRTAEIIDSGAFGPPRMITAVNFTDYLYRPRRAEELATGLGGSAIFSQAPHQVDVVRLLGGGHVRSVRAATGRWDSARPTEGAYTALLTFDNGVAASLTYSGYGHFDTDEFVGWVGEMGQARDPQQYGAARRVLRMAARPEEEAALKDKRTYGGAMTNGSSAATPLAPVAYNHFGSFIVSCERADLRPLPNGVMIYADDERWFEALAMPDVPRSEVVDELVSTIRDGGAPLHSAEWGMATLEVCLAILESARESREVTLCHQTGMPPITGRFSPPAAK